MSKYIFTYYLPKSYNPMADSGTLPTWQKFFDTIGTSVVDPGWPVFEPAQPVGEIKQGTRLAGYSVVTAENLEAALALAKVCPTLKAGGGVEVGPLAELPAEHPAEVLRSRRQGS